MRIHQRFTSRVVTRDRGVIAEGFRRSFNTASKEAWQETAEHFHENMRDERFTPEHAAKARYYLRKGQGQPLGSKSFKRSYYGRKFRSANHGGGANQANPLEYTGETRRAVRTGYRIEATRYGAKISYSGARKFNFRHPKSKIVMHEEFTRLLPEETQKLARVYDDALDRRWRPSRG